MTASAITKSSAQLHDADLIDQAVGGHHVAVGRDIDVAYDVAAAWDRPGLELLCCRIETHDRVRLGVGLVVVDRALGEGDAIGLRLRPTRRLPLLMLASAQIE